MTNYPVPLSIRLFGAPEVELFGKPLALNNQKARALMFFLAITGHPHTRSYLATLFWSEFPTKNGRRSLRSVIFQLRRAFQTAGLSRIIINDGDLLGLDRAKLDCDVAEFYHLVAAGSEQSLAAAVNLHRGQFLQGFTLRDTPLFDEWVRREGEKINRTYSAILRQLASEAEAAKDWQGAIAYLQLLVNLTPEEEEAQSWLIRLYLESGAFSQALRQYHRFESELRKTAGIEPSSATKAMFYKGLRLLQTPLSARIFPEPESSRPLQPSLPFVGRQGLLDRLLVLSQDIQNGRGGTILLQGDGGIGKTRLLSEFLNQLRYQEVPWLVLQGSCSPFDELISYGPFLEAFQDTPFGDLTDLLLSGESEEPIAREQFIYRILQTLRQLSRNVPIALTLDDLQWANSSTLNLFGLLSTRLQNLPVMLVGTVQRYEAIPALQRLISIERRRKQLQLFTLAPFTGDDVTELLDRLGFSQAAITSLAQWLQERSGGNPLILEEIIAQLQAEAILTPAGNQWLLDTSAWLRWRTTYTLPETTKDLVSWRLRNLTTEAYTVLEVLAVAGQPVSYGLLKEFISITSEELMSYIAALLNKQLLSEEEEDRFSLSHLLLRETILQRLTHVRRRAIHRRLSQLLAKESTIKRDVPLWEIARHAVAGEEIDLARQYGLQIISNLPHDSTGADTVDFLHHIYDLLAPSASSNEQLQLTHALGSVHQSLGHLEEAAFWYQRYLQLAVKIKNFEIQTTAHFEMGELALVRNDYVAATKSAEAGLAVCDLLSKTDLHYRMLVGRGNRLLGTALAMEGQDLILAESYLQKATAVRRLEANLEELGASLFELGNIAAQQGDLRRALNFYEEAAQTADACQAYYLSALAYNNIAYHALLMGQLQDAQDSLAVGQLLAETHELLGAVLHLSSTQAELYLYLAEWDYAKQTLLRGLNLAEELSNLERQAGFRAGLALVERSQNNLTEAITLLKEALIIIDDLGYWHLRTRIFIWLTETFLRLGETSEAWLNLIRAEEMAHAQGRTLLILQTMRLRARLLAADKKWEKAERCFKEAIALASELDIPLEIARGQAALGQAIIQNASSSVTGNELLEQAHQVFVQHEAKADLYDLSFAQLL